MASTSIVFGIALICVGIGGFLPHHAPTALIPAYMGAVLILCGIIATNAAFRMHAMHVAVLVALLGFLAAGWRLVLGLTKPTVDSVAVSSQGITVLLCGIFVALCVRSFIAARRARTQ